MLEYGHSAVLIRGNMCILLGDGRAEVIFVYPFFQLPSTTFS